MLTIRWSLAFAAIRFNGDWSLSLLYTVLNRPLIPHYCTSLTTINRPRQTAVASLKQSLNLQDCVGLVRELLEYMQDGISSSLRQC